MPHTYHPDGSMIMRVLVVGGTGNISTGVIKYLLEFGHDVTVFNRGVTKRPLPKEVKVIHGDRHDLNTFEKTMQENKFDAAIDMICYTPEEAESDLRAFRDVKHFIHVSTVAVFGGEPAEYPINENTRRNPVIEYSRNKVAADNVFMNAYKEYGFPVTIFMPAQTWGYQDGIVRQLGGGNIWIDRVRKGLPILVTHEGNLIWAHCHSDDVGLGIAAAVGRERCIGESYIITRWDMKTWRDYHEEIAWSLGQKANLVDAPAELLIKVWPEGTWLLASESRWNRIYSLDKIRRDIPEFNPRITLADWMPDYVRDLDARGLIPDARSDDTEDRIIRNLERMISNFNC